MEYIAKKRRPRGEGALGKFETTKEVSSLLIEKELKDRLSKTQRLREMRLAAPMLLLVSANFDLGREYLDLRGSVVAVAQTAIPTQFKIVLPQGTCDARV